MSRHCTVKDEFHLFLMWVTAVKFVTSSFHNGHFGPVGDGLVGAGPASEGK